MHPIEGRATELTGTLDVEVADGVVTGLHSGRLEVPVRSLRSGNPLEDGELQRRVEARRFPVIVGEVRNATALDGGRLRVDGDLTFHGVTQSVTGEVRIATEGDRVVLEGEHVFDVRRFDITSGGFAIRPLEPVEATLAGISRTPRRTARAREAGPGHGKRR